MSTHCRGAHQVFDEDLQLFLGQTHGLLFPYDGDQLLLRVVRRREDDASPRPVAHPADIGPTAADQEFMVLWFGLQLSREVVDLLKGARECLFIFISSV